MNRLLSLLVPAFLAAIAAVALSGCAGAGAVGGGASSPAPAAARTIEVTTTDEMRFEPADFQVAVGETVSFEVTNAGKVVHEFYVGTAEEQVAHEEEMKAGHSTHDHANSVSVDPGQTKSLVLTFARAGTLEVGCHVPGHWEAGMKGTITVR
jgi:uncharacterized cupredoxin-like copper-binding protein